MFDSFILFIEHLSTIIPLPIFVFVGSFLEEIIAPIPSPLVMSAAGTVIQSREQSWLYILLIVIIGSIGKTIASLILYFFSDKLEDKFTGRFGKYLKISHKDLEGIGKHFNNSKRDDILLFVLRAVPLFPNAPVSILCGVIKINIRTYAISTFTGTIIKNLIYIYAGYLSLDYIERLNSGYQAIETLGYLLLILIVLYFFVFKDKRRKYFKNKILQLMEKLNTK